MTYTKPELQNVEAALAAIRGFDKGVLEIVDSQELISTSAAYEADE